MENLPMNTLSPHRSNCSADDPHFGGIKPISAHPIAGAAGWNNVGNDMTDSVINSVTTQGFIRSPAIGTYGVQNILGNPLGSYVGRKSSLGIERSVSVKKREGLAGTRCIIAAGSSFSAVLFLLRRVAPSLLAPVSPLLSRTMAGSTFVGQAKGTASVFKEDVRGCWQFLIAAVAKAKTGLGGDTSYSRHFNNIARPPFQVNNGPHWQLPWGAYP